VKKDILPDYRVEIKYQPVNIIMKLFCKTAITLNYSKIILVCIVLLALTGCCEYKFVNMICQDCSVTKTILLSDSIPTTHINRRVLLMKVDTLYNFYVSEKDFFENISGFIKEHPHIEDNKKLLQYFLNASFTTTYHKDSIINISSFGEVDHIKFRLVELLIQKKCIIKNRVTGKYEAMCQLNTSIEGGSGGRKVLIDGRVLLQSYNFFCIPDYSGP
jgi:hypothetical protein